MAKISSLTEIGLRSTHKNLFKKLSEGMNMESSSTRMWYAWGLSKNHGYSKTNQDVCSRGLYHISSEDKKKGVRIFPTIRPSMLEKHKEESVRFFNWVTRDSIFANALKTRSFAHAFTYGYSLNAEEDVYLTHFGCQLIRQLQEHPAKVLVWDKLVQDHGVEPLAAFVLSERICGSLDSVSWNSEYRHGDLFNPRDTSMAKVLSGSPELKRVSYRQSASYSGVGGMFSGEGSDNARFSHALHNLPHHERLRVFAKEQAMAKKTKPEGYINPFAMAQEVSKVSPEAAAAYLAETFKEFLCP